MAGHVIFIIEELRGTGASCIYPLLACALHPNWSFMATEVDEQSIAVALQNVQSNGLPIRVSRVTSVQDPLLGILAEQSDSVDFCMCNPPFYESAKQIERARASKSPRSLPPTPCTEGEAIYEMAEGEESTSGGEIAFVRRLVRESESLSPKTCRWFTTLLGFKSSVTRLEAYLRREGSPVQQIKVMPSQVGRTKRWILAWSLQRPTRIRRRTAEREQGKRWIIEVSSDATFRLENLETLLEELQIKKGPAQTYEATHRLWTRRARRSGQADECHLSFNLAMVGRTFEFTLQEGDPIEFNTFINSLRHRITRR